MSKITGALASDMILKKNAYLLQGFRSQNCNLFRSWQSLLGYFQTEATEFIFSYDTSDVGRVKETVLFSH